MSKTIVLITNSQYGAVVEQLDAIESLNDVECYIYPVMCVSKVAASVHGVVKESESPLIPKKLHYIWVGGSKLPAHLAKCIDTWREYCPEYEIVCWNENNYDFSKYPGMKCAFEAGKWAHASDFARLDILCEHGGIYMDTDVYLVRNLEPLLYQEAFASVEKWNVVNTGGCCGTVKDGDAIRALLEFRKRCDLEELACGKGMQASGFYETKALEEYGFVCNGERQNILGMNIYPYDFFHPYDYMSAQLQKSDNTFSVHCFNGGWINDEISAQRKLTQVNYEKTLRRTVAEVIKE